MPKDESDDESSVSGEEIAPNAKLMHNNRYDEAHELSESNFEGSVDSADSGDGSRGDSPPAFGNSFGGDTPPMSEDDDYEFSLGESQDSEIPGGKDELMGEIEREMAKETIDMEEKALDTDCRSSEEESSEEEVGFAAPKHNAAAKSAQAKAAAKADSESEEEEEEEESSSDEDVPRQGATVTATPSKGQYNAAEYANLDVDDDVRSLFDHIARFTPQDVELKTIVKPFIPDYIAAIGELDIFVKVPRPDGGQTPGLAVLDEPKTVQSDATVLAMQLKATSKRASNFEVNVPSMEAPDHRALSVLIEKWVDNVAAVHATKTQVEVQYTRPMPDIDALMQVWPEEIEEALGGLMLPPPEMSMSIENYVRMICSVLDIPIHPHKDGIVQSLHVLFTLFVEFSQNQHFNNDNNSAPSNSDFAAAAADYT